MYGLRVWTPHSPLTSTFRRCIRSRSFELIDLGRGCGTHRSSCLSTNLCRTLITVAPLSRSPVEIVLCSRTTAFNISTTKSRSIPSFKPSCSTSGGRRTSSGPDAYVAFRRCSPRSFETPMILSTNDLPHQARGGPNSMAQPNTSITLFTKSFAILHQPLSTLSKLNACPANCGINEHIKVGPRATKSILVLRTSMRTSPEFRASNTTGTLLNIVCNAQSALGLTSREICAPKIALVFTSTSNPRYQRDIGIKCPVPLGSITLT